MGEQPSSGFQQGIVRSKELSANRKQFCSARRNSNRIWLIIEKRRPTIFKLGQRCSRYSATKKFSRNRLQTRLGGSRLRVEPLQRFPPPGEPDGA